MQGEITYIARRNQNYAGLLSHKPSQRKTPMRALVMTAVLLGSSSLYPAFAQHEGSLSLPTRPKLSLTSRSERPSNRNNRAIETESAPTTFQPALTRERNSAIQTV